MLAIRLSRTGRNKYPTYRIVAAESARAATGKFVAILGHYNPHTKELVIKHDETLKYLGNGAQPSNSVIKLLQREKIKLPDWVSLKSKHTAPKKAVSPVAPASSESSTPENSDESNGSEAETNSTVAAVAADHSIASEGKVPNSTNLDNDHTETATVEAEQVDKAVGAEATAAEAAIKKSPKNSQDL